MEKTPVIEIGSHIESKDMYFLLDEQLKIQFTQKAQDRVNEGRNLLEKFISDKIPIYGVTTGFGVLENTWISKEDQDQLQENLIKSHAIGTGPIMPKALIFNMLYKHGLGFTTRSVR